MTTVGLFGSSSSSSHHQRPRSLEEQVKPPPPPPVQVGEISEEELKQYDGSDDKKPLLMSIKGQIYDVSQSRMFYGPGGPYALFAGKDASRALAKMSFEKEDLTGDISGLGPFELEALQDWEYKFMSKYVKVGTVKKEVVPVTDESTPLNLLKLRIEVQQSQRKLKMVHPRRQQRKLWKPLLLSMPRKMNSNGALDDT
ncbi:hypothetical protein Nepgr_010839 [Nepenthes gracilis]|uniref:Cytochrome b5 heme-binding domain-containing protein n=1 Tax=Nepenthes gracilis TaxID=150966 RepID=A0AAD3XLQ1_NEPGR|nr:hypothetical protein Nepgr_010839 [Nepenthes gracilis]